ncbi:MAG TPA: hypothetical protein V6D17_23455, partial [Candidatus Obscuribacterales bacterium]
GSAVATFVFSMFDSFGMGFTTVFSPSNYKTKGDVLVGLCAAAFATFAALLIGTVLAAIKLSGFPLIYVGVVVWGFAFFVASFVFGTFKQVFGR